MLKPLKYLTPGPCQKTTWEEDEYSILQNIMKEVALKDKTLIIFPLD